MASRNIRSAAVTCLQVARYNQLEQPLSGRGRDFFDKYDCAGQASSSIIGTPAQRSSVSFPFLLQRNLEGWLVRWTEGMTSIRECTFFWNAVGHEAIRDVDHASCRTHP